MIEEAKINRGRNRKKPTTVTQRFKTAAIRNINELFMTILHFITTVAGIVIFKVVYESNKYFNNHLSDV